MSLLAIIFIAVTIPFSVIFVAFTWFFIRSRFTENKKGPRQRSATDSQVSSAHIPLSRVEVTARQHQNTISPPYTPTYNEPSWDHKPTYQPLSHFLDDDSAIALMEPCISMEYDIQFDLTVIPGITKHIEKNLHELGYTCVEQIARWGRADVRAVSADLGVEQQRIEDEWIANARLIMSLR